MQPRASRDRVVGLHGDALKIQIAAPPVEGAANKALVALIAKALGVAKRDVEVVTGSGSRAKRVRIRGASVDDVRRALLGSDG